MPAYCDLGAALRRGDSYEAVAVLREATRISPDFADAYFQLGCILDAQGKGDDAAAAFRELNRLKPGFSRGERPAGPRQDEPSTVAEKTSLAQKTIALPSSTQFQL